MALDSAMKLAEELQENPELREKFEADAQAALAAGDYGCTLDELDEAILMSREIDESELDIVSGGRERRIFGNCPECLYKEDCSATVEENSICASNDRCARWDVIYTCERTPCNNKRISRTAS